MSTKIFWGVQFPVEDLGRFVNEARVSGMKRVEKHARVLLKLEPQRKHPKDPRKRLYRQVTAVLDKIGEAAASSERNFLYDVNYGWTVWFPPQRPFVLASPWGSWAHEAKPPRWVVKYPYWDNSDRPNDVSPREWNRRAHVWDVACQPNDRSHKLVLTVFDGTRRSLDMSWLELRLMNHTLSNGKRFGTPRVFG